MGKPSEKIFHFGNLHIYIVCRLSAKDRLKNVIFGLVVALFSWWALCLLCFPECIGEAGRGFSCAGAAVVHKHLQCIW